MYDESFLQNKLVATKLMVPSLSRWLPRQRLSDLLNEGLKHKLTLVKAPTGFGKTTLLASWLEQNTKPASAAASYKAAWVSLDESDNDPKVFCMYLLAALEYAEPGLAQPLLEQLQNSPDILLQEVLTGLINRLLQYNQPLALILDDYHHMTASAVHSTLSYLLDYLPPQLHIFVLSRSTPALPLSRLRTRGQMLELNAEMLRCTTDEAARFFSEISEVNIPPHLLREICQRTEGWLVGLQLVGLLLGRYSSFDQVLAELNGSQPYIRDYLTEEVLAGQPAEIQDFLYYTATLPQFCAELCDAMLDRTDSQAVLDYLEANSLFILRLEGQSDWYRYHPLFADVLRYYLARRNPDTLNSLHEKANRWYDTQARETQTTKSSQLPLTTLKTVTPKTTSPKSFYLQALPEQANMPVVIEPLSARELQVLDLMMQGTTNYEIAGQLSLSHNTIKKHTSNIFSKLGVPNRTQAAYRARQLGLVME